MDAEKQAKMLEIETANAKIKAKEVVTVSWTRGYSPDRLPTRWI